MPQGWYGLTPFKWKLGTLADSSMRQITAVKITLSIHHSWGGGSAQYALEYGLRDSFFETRIAHFEYSGKEHPPQKVGQGPTKRDSIFQQRFAAERLFRVLHNIQKPSPYWTEADFGYERSKFRLDLMQLPRTRMDGYHNCQDCSWYNLNIQFLKGEKTVATIALGFDSLFRLPRTADTAVRQFGVKAMLEWMYLYQLCHLFFPENEALNKSHFHEKGMADFAAWAKKMFPEMNE